MSSEAEKSEPAQLDKVPKASGDTGTQLDRPLPEAPVCEPRLLSLLVCPFTRTSLGFDTSRQELISRPEHLAFPIRDGIPILVREEARSLDDKP